MVFFPLMADASNFGPDMDVRPYSSNSLGIKQCLSQPDLCYLPACAHDIWEGKKKQLYWGGPTQGETLLGFRTDAFTQAYHLLAFPFLHKRFSRVSRSVTISKTSVRLSRV